jgi:hypothetical protein
MAVCPPPVKSIKSKHEVQNKGISKARTSPKTMREETYFIAAL